jgi:hypothetical protein
MTETEKARWTEVQFYLIVQDLFNLNHKIQDVMDTIDNLSYLVNYNSTLLKSFANEALVTMRIKPYKEEMYTLAYKAGIPVKDIKQKFGIYNKTLYGILDKNDLDPFYIYPKSSKQKQEQAELFIKAINIIKGVGIWTKT